MMLSCDTLFMTARMVVTRLPAHGHLCSSQHTATVDILGAASATPEVPPPTATLPVLPLPPSWPTWRPTS
jgi:hypothetical protein